MNRQIGALLFALGLGVTVAWAQQNTPVQPIPPAGVSSSKGSGDSGGPAVPTAVAADNRPLSGAEQFGLGSLIGRRNTLVMGLQFQEMADSNSTNATSGTDWNSASFLTGDIALHHFWSRSELIAGYTGGGALYNTQADLNQTFHAASLTERVNWRRWSLLLSDQASYLPASSFGFNGLGSLAGVAPGLGSQFATVNPVFDPSQSILTGLARRVSNAVVGEVDYSISRRSSFTVSGSFGLLHFLDSGFIDNHGVIARSGYNYALNGRDTVGVVYMFIRFSFGQQSATMQNHTAQLAYGRRITGRLALQLFAGPQVNTFQNVSSNPGAQVSWSAGSFLRYQMIRSSIGLSYTHGITGGSGVFAGAKSDQVDATADRQLSRRSGGNLTAGYARNTALQEILLVPTNFRFNSWYAGAGLNHLLTPRVSLFFTYNFQHQDSNGPACTTGSCATSFLRHQFGLGFNWNFQQRGID